MLYNIVILPIETIVDWVFKFSTNKMPQIGVMGAICCVSIVINFLALPLYNIADSLQEKERNIQQSLSKWVKHIKKNFKGDERFMMLQTYYRENGYHPLYALRSSLSILIEIPFFIAAYHYLSNCQVLNSAEFWIFKNLGQPDRLFSIEIGNFSFIVNILPILMTGINIVSGWIYTKGATKKEKIQLYIMALLFLVLLYKSPSGLVLYWILNNIFSLVKNVASKAKSPKKIAHFSITFMLLLASSIILQGKSRLFVKISVFIFTTIIAFTPLITKILSSRVSKKTELKEVKDGYLFLLLGSGFGLAFIAGLVLPATSIASSPIEFSFLGRIESPLKYVWTSFCLFLGFFIFWPLSIYKMFGTKVRRVLPFLVFALLCIALSNIYIFKYTYGNLNTSFEIENINLLKNYSVFFILLPLVFCIILGALIFLAKKFKKESWLSIISLSLCIGEFGYGFYKCAYIKKEFESYKNNLSTSNSFENQKKDYISPIYHLSRTEKNVLVLFLDRAMTGFFPYSLQQFPKCKESFSGFTYFPNTLSFGENTNHGSPAMMGGYEYTPENINKRKNETLQKKHNEASLVLPKFFIDAGFSVTVTDPPCPDYTWKAHLGPFKEYPEINVSEVIGNYSKFFLQEHGLKNSLDLSSECDKQIKNFSILQIIFPILRATFYENCRSIPSEIYKSESEHDFTPEEMDYINNFSNLYYLRKLTDFGSSSPTYTFICNETTHSPSYLNAPIYDFPERQKNYTEESLKTKSEVVEKHYHSFVASLKQICLYFDFLRKNNCYDNTRIIIVSDHGYRGYFDDFDNFPDPGIPTRFCPLFLVKDFNAKGKLKTDNALMTNADTVIFATKKLDTPPINPFTKNRLDERQVMGGVNVYLTQRNSFVDGFDTDKMRVEKYTEFPIDKKQAWHVQDNLYEPKNWIPLTEWEKMNGGAEQ